MSADAGANGFWTSLGGAVGGNSSAGFRVCPAEGRRWGRVGAVVVRLAMGLFTAEGLLVLGARVYGGAGGG